MSKVFKSKFKNGVPINDGHPLSVTYSYDPFSQQYKIPLGFEMLSEILQELEIISQQIEGVKKE